MKITTLKPINNKVLVKPDFIKTAADAEYRMLKLPSGLEVFVDFTWDPNTSRPVSGQVISICDKLDCGTQTGFDWETTVEAKVGDKVGFHYLVSEDCLLREYGLFVEDGQVYFLLDYFELFYAQRVVEDVPWKFEVIPLNGYMLCADAGKNLMEIRYKSSPVKYLPKGIYPDDEDCYGIGDIAISDNLGDIPLAFDFNQALPEHLYRVQRRYLKGKVTNVNI